MFAKAELNTNVAAIEVTCFGLGWHADARIEFDCVLSNRMPHYYTNAQCIRDVNSFAAFVDCLGVGLHFFMWTLPFISGLC